MLRKIFIGRKFFTALAMVMLMTAVLSAPGAKNHSAAKPCFSILVTYYSDATFTEAVGGRYTPCAGQPYSWGTTTAYHDQDTESCYDNSNPYTPHC